MEDRHRFKEVPQLLQIGATGRNSGKTVVAQSLIQRFKNNYSIVGIKIITINGAKGKCQRGGVGCGICTSIQSDYAIDVEETKTGSKDTMRLLAAGCQKVFLLRACGDALEAGFEALLQQVPKDTILICESNSLRQIVHPGLFLMLDNHPLRAKPTAKAVYNQADMILTGTKDPRLENISIEMNEQSGNNTWINLAKQPTA